jgi:hypothetical protein
MKQQNQSYNPDIKTKRRSSTPSRHGKVRANLVKGAQYVAHELWTEVKQPITAGQVYEMMWDAMENDPDTAGILEQYDKRWLGAVFRGEEWERVGYIPAGSHGRLVAQWVPKTEAKKLAS